MFAVSSMREAETTRPLVTWESNGKLHYVEMGRVPKYLYDRLELERFDAQAQAEKYAKENEDKEDEDAEEHKEEDEDGQDASHEKKPPPPSPSPPPPPPPRQARRRQHFSAPRQRGRDGALRRSQWHDGPQPFQQPERGVLERVCGPRGVGRWLFERLHPRRSRWSQAAPGKGDWSGRAAWP